VNRWGFNGIIDTDRGALTFMVTRHKYYPNMAVAAAGAIHAGVNQFLNQYQSAVKSALQQKLITVKEIDHNLSGVLRVMIRLGFLDPPALDPYTRINGKELSPPWDQASSKRLALRATEESIVLLKDSSHLLPLDPSTTRSIAVLGPMANAVYSDGYGGTPPFAITPLEGIRDIAGTHVAIRYSNQADQAVELARKSEVAILFLGNRPFCRRHVPGEACPNPTEGQEGIDRREIHLPADQQKLIRQVYAANPRTIVVLVSSFPFTIDWAKHHVPAILNVAQSSEEEGAALANVIFGKYDPAGRLTITWPASIRQLPPMMDYDIRDGRTYMYFKGAPLFPFGFGLSYTTFQYSDMHLSRMELSTGKSLNVAVKVKNAGSRSGDEVVQLYVQFVGSKVRRPRLELEGFKRVYIPVHESRLVTIPLAANSLRHWDTSRNRWVLEKGKVRLLIGSSSGDIKSSKTVFVR
jgi:beta-glucosidase